jgi:HD-like signal output (HDOD) protein
MKPPIDTYLRDSSKLPSLPEIYFKLEEAIQNPLVSFEEVGEIVSRDLGLSTRLLCIANSSLFSFPSKINTISRAITLVGMQQLRDLVLATEMINLFRNFKSDTVNMKSFLLHSIACGTVARVMATYRHEPNVELFYVTGLLHDLGRLCLYLQSPELMEEALRMADAEQIPLHQAEIQIFGFDHAMLGGHLLKKWNLSPAQQDGVCYHHQPMKSERYPVVSYITHTADIFALAIWSSSSGSISLPPLSKKVWAKLGLKPAMIGELVKQSEKIYTETLELFFQ